MMLSKMYCLIISQRLFIHVALIVLSEFGNDYTYFKVYNKNN